MQIAVQFKCEYDRSIVEHDVARCVDRENVISEASPYVIRVRPDGDLLGNTLSSRFVFSRGDVPECADIDIQLEVSMF